MSMWSSADLQYIQENHPLLKVNNSDVIEGSLFFQAIYLEDKLIINPSVEILNNYGDSECMYICDGYNIRIIWGNNGLFPISFETAGKIINTGERIGKSPADMHLFTDTGELCLASPLEIVNSLNNQPINLQTYIELFLIPYLFAQSHYSKYQVWPWGELSHGCWGLLEWLGGKNYSKDIVLQTYLLIKKMSDDLFFRHLFSSRCRSHKECPCLSGRKTKDCHPNIKEGICRIRNLLSGKM